MKRLFAVAGAVLMLTYSCAYAASLLTEPQARAKAIGILTGDPYGKTPAEVARNIKQARLVQNGNTKACGATGHSAWEFHVVVARAENGAINGYLALDARTGKMLCANLPFLD